VVVGLELFSLDLILAVSFELNIETPVGPALWMFSPMLVFLCLSVFELATYTG